MNRSALVAGDVVALALVTLIGFGSHGEFSAAFLPRMAAAFLPLCLGWFALAPWFGLFDASRAAAPSQLWLPAFVMLFAGPFAGIIRAILLGTAAVPSFVIVFSLTGAVALVAWRAIYLFVGRRGEARQRP